MSFCKWKCCRSTSQRRCVPTETGWCPAAREQEGFRGAWLLTDPESGEGLSISLLESAEDMLASEESEFHHRELGELEDFFISAPVRKHYEVSVKE